MLRITVNFSILRSILVRMNDQGVLFLRKVEKGCGQMYSGGCQLYTVNKSISSPKTLSNLLGY